MTFLEEMLILDEGKKNHPYKDSLGNWTIGVGYYIGKNLESLFLSNRVIKIMLEEKIDSARTDVLAVFGIDLYCSWTPARRDAIMSLMYNMGLGDANNGFLSFGETIKLIRNGEWLEAANNLSKSLWSKQVDPPQRIGKGRDDRIIYAFRTGEYHPDYKIKN